MEFCNGNDLISPMISPHFRFHYSRNISESNIEMKLFACRNTILSFESTTVFAVIVDSSSTFKQPVQSDAFCIVSQIYSRCVSTIKCGSNVSRKRQIFTFKPGLVWICAVCIQNNEFPVISDCMKNVHFDYFIIKLRILYLQVGLRLFRIYTSKYYCCWS